MKNNLFQRYWHSEVARKGNNIIIGKTKYCDNNHEIIVSLELDVKSFKMHEFSVEKYFEGNTTYKKYAGNQSVVYLGNESKLKKILKDNVEDILTAEIFNDTVRTLIQAETFLFKERGFSSEREYSDYWEKIYKNKCCYYSNLERLTTRWDEHVGNHSRHATIFTRFKTQHLIRDIDSYNICGSLLDSFHHININLNLNISNNKIKDAMTTMIRIPDLICNEATEYLSNLKGIDITTLSKKELAACLGHRQGCTHMIDLITDSASTLRRFLSDQGYS